jgi:hypothetical protein
MPSSREGSIKNNESEIFLLKRRIKILEEEFHGLAYDSTPHTVSIATVETYVDLVSSPTLSDASAGTEALTGRLGLKNVSGKARTVRVQATYDAAPIGAGAQMRLRLVMDGTPIPGAECAASTTAAGVIAKLHSFAIVRVPDGSELWMQAANWTNTNDISFLRGRMGWHRTAGVFRPRPA